ncbi:MAG: hypothetical protein Ct9H90mP24_3980 [Methanobacteriota archaeon]|nr:MAG: hypothetical protein Ct9H90mP24_3980 [Euryarchaeota archaeon]
MLWCHHLPMMVEDRRTSEPDAPGASNSRQCVGTLFNSDLPFEVLQVPSQKANVIPRRYTQFIDEFQRLQWQSYEIRILVVPTFFHCEHAFFGPFSRKYSQMDMGIWHPCFLRPSVGPQTSLSLSGGSRSRLPRMDLPRSFHPVLESLVRICPDGLPRV